MLVFSFLYLSLCPYAILSLEAFEKYRLSDAADLTVRAAGATNKVSHRTFPERAFWAYETSYWTRLFIIWDIWLLWPLFKQSQYVSLYSFQLQHLFLLRLSFAHCVGCRCPLACSPQFHCLATSQPSLVDSDAQGPWHPFFITCWDSHCTLLHCKHWVPPLNCSQPSLTCCQWIANLEPWKMKVGCGGWHGWRLTWLHRDSQTPCPKAMQGSLEDLEPHFCSNQEVCTCLHQRPDCRSHSIEVMSYCDQLKFVNLFQTTIWWKEEEKQELRAASLRKLLEDGN